MAHENSIPQNVAGLSLKGGRRDQFFFSLLEYYPEDKRWFLKSLLQVKDSEEAGGDEAIREWIEDYELSEIVLDVPLTLPTCSLCHIDCPGERHCPHPEVVEVRRKIDSVLEEDARMNLENPKNYEFARNEDDTFDFLRDITHRPSTTHIISRSFKRRLKKGYLPYWNREVDFWVWCYYYDQLLELFNTSFDSYGNSSLMVQHRFSYLRRHFPDKLALFECNTQIILVELLRSGVIRKSDIQRMNDLVEGPEAKLDIIKKVEEKLNVFIYDHDLELLVKNPRAFESFLLALAGKNIIMGKNKDLPEWTKPNEVSFISPTFD
ncbi:hypothetical protein OAT67_07795 [Bacteriovoracaceae bacterium]|nr:hypothetical protein [Bacteriovoracaceae bacterium]|tara:strand:+ start:104078 stop:105040 length:963 start_codon:yes stop_codon:yes gene_type:complete